MKAAEEIAAGFVPGMEINVRIHQAVGGIGAQHPGLSTPQVFNCDFGLGQLPVPHGAEDRPGDCRVELFQIDRLIQKVDRAVAKRFGDKLLFAFRGYDNYSQAGIPFSNPCQQIKARVLRHSVIRYHTLERPDLFGRKMFPGAGRIFGDGDGVAAFDESELKKGAADLIVLNYEDPAIRFFTGMPNRRIPWREAVRWAHLSWRTNFHNSTFTHRLNP